MSRLIAEYAGELMVVGCDAIDSKVVARIWNSVFETSAVIDEFPSRAHLIAEQSWFSSAQSVRLAASCRCIRVCLVTLLGSKASRRYVRFSAAKGQVSFQRLRFRVEQAEVLSGLRWEILLVDTMSSRQVQYDGLLQSLRSLLRVRRWEEEIVGRRGVGPTSSDYSARVVKAWRQCL